MRPFIRKVFFAIAPRSATSLMSARARAHSHRVLASWGCGPVNQKLIERLGSRVRGGPFAGLVLTRGITAEQIGPYLLGVYESEIHEAWDLIFREQYSQVVDIGAKFGYYAVGLALRYPNAPVVAFDTDWWARRALRDMTAANGVGNVEVRGFCSVDWLAGNLRHDALVVSDCEGYETTILQPGRVGQLRSATLIIETHDGLVPGTCDHLKETFGKTHSVRSFSSGVPRRVPDALDFLSEAERGLAVHEVRSAGVWLLCIPRERTVP